MLQRVAIRNFRTIRELEWYPRKLNVLVGPNNSGKTNLCYALRFLAAAARYENIDDAAAEACGSVTEVPCRFAHEDITELDVVARVPLVGGQEDEFRYTLRLRAAEARDLGRGQALVVAAERLERSGMRDWPPLIERVEDQVSLFNEGRHGRPGGSERDRVETTAPPRETMLHRLYEDQGNPSATAFKRCLRRLTYYRTDPSDLRRQAPIFPDPVLASNGANLASVLYTMKNEDEGLYRQLLGLISEIEPRLEFFRFVPLADETVVAEVEMRGGERPLSMSAVSDGTLRYLALATISLQSLLRTTREVEWPSVAMIEEPENGLYARYLRKLVERLEHLSEHTQTIITTHSPFVLDYFDDRPESIFVVRTGDSDEGTSISPLNPERLRAMLEHTSMGEMLFSEVLA